jgi:hypothetical protein
MEKIGQPTGMKGFPNWENPSYHGGVALLTATDFIKQPLLIIKLNEAMKTHFGERIHPKCRKLVVFKLVPSVCSI